jgi:hypothetical protein
MTQPKWPSPEKFTGEAAKARLEEMFDRDYGMDRPGTAFIHVSVMGPYCVRYGSYQRISREQLKGRAIDYEWVDYAPGIIVRDSEFNPKGCVWSNPL